MENKKFSQALHDWRKKKQLTQEDVANKLGVSRTIVSLYPHKKASEIISEAFLFAGVALRVAFLVLLYFCRFNHITSFTATYP